MVWIDLYLGLSSRGSPPLLWAWHRCLSAGSGSVASPPPARCSSLCCTSWLWAPDWPHTATATPSWNRCPQPYLGWPQPVWPSGTSPPAEPTPAAGPDNTLIQPMQSYISMLSTRVCIETCGLKLTEMSLVRCSRDISGFWRLNCDFSATELVQVSYSLEEYLKIKYKISKTISDIFFYVCQN